MKTTDKRRVLLAGAALLLAVAFVALGVGRGEVSTVFQKAVNICFECIGLG